MTGTTSPKPPGGPPPEFQPTESVAAFPSDWEDVADLLYFAICAWHRGTYNATQGLDKALRAYEAYERRIARYDGRVCSVCGQPLTVCNENCR